MSPLNSTAAAVRPVQDPSAERVLPVSTALESRPAISLAFADGIQHPVRARMDYAFRVFAALYGYPVATNPGAADMRFVYGGAGAPRHHTQEFRVPSRYKAQPSTAAPNLQRITHADEDFFLVYGRDPESGNPDWLGEIFEWLSGALELGITERDGVGRIPYDATLFHRQKISPFRPHAALLMAWLDGALQSAQRPALSAPPSPLRELRHAVVCTHDIDFSYTGRRHTAQRIGKNVVTSIIEHHSPSFLLSNLKLATDCARGLAVGDYIPRMVDEIEALGFRSTLFAVAERRHRRDPQYHISVLSPSLRDAASRGFEIGLHASYTSLEGDSTVRREAGTLLASTGIKPIGNRQHWLRMDHHANLYAAVERAHFAYDSTLGFATMCGFRNGANFAFPPYDFERERPCSFLEIPLAVMDGALHRASRTLRNDPQELTNQILSESRKWGWGGFSVLWHNPIEPLQVPPEINAAFWAAAREQKQHGEQWMTARDFVNLALPQYQRAGLLRKVCLDA